MQLIMIAASVSHAVQIVWAAKDQIPVNNAKMDLITVNKIKNVYKDAKLETTLTKHQANVLLAQLTVLVAIMKTNAHHVLLDLLITMWRKPVAKLDVKFVISDYLVDAELDTIITHWTKSVFQIWMMKEKSLSMDGMIWRHF